MLNKFN